MARARAVAHLVSSHAAKDADEANDPADTVQRAHEERTLTTLRRNAQKLRTALADTSDRIGARDALIKRNLAEPDSATLKGSHGVVQGYIGAAPVDTEHRAIVEAQAHGVPQEHDLPKPVIDGTRGHLAAIGAGDLAATAAYLADAGYHSERGLEALYAERIDGHIADGQMRQRDLRYAEAARQKPARKAKTFQPRDFSFYQDRNLGDQQSTAWPAGRVRGGGGAERTRIAT